MNSTMFRVAILCCVVSMSVFGAGELDYCGLEDSDKSINPYFNVSVLSGTNVSNITEYLSSPWLGMTNEILTRGRYIDMLPDNMLVKCELAWIANDEHLFRRNAMLLGELLRIFDAYSDVIGDHSAKRLRERFEYLLARIINSRKTNIVLTDDDIRSYLPAMPNDGIMDRPYRPRQETFRTMLIIGAAIQKYRIMNGKLPSSLSELGISRSDILDAWGEAITYRHSSTEWKLYSKASTDMRDDLGISDFIPIIDRVTGIPHGLWYASSYSEKRKRFFKERYLRIGMSPFALSMDSGGTIRLRDADAEE